MRQLNTGAHLIRMQKINTENIYKYLQPEKKNSGGFKKSLRFYKNQADLRITALLQKSGGFTESLRFYKNQVDLRNHCAFTKIRQIYRILALLQKSGGFTEYLRFTEKQADD